MISTSSSAATSIKKEYRYRFFWHMWDHYSPGEYTGHYLPSVKFDFELGNNMHFKADFSVAGETCEKRKLIGSFESTSKAYWKFSCTVLGNQGYKVARIVVTKKKPRVECSLLTNVRWWCCFHDLNDLLIFDIMHVGYTYTLNPTSQVLKYELNTHSKELYETKEFPDVLLKVGDKEIPVHKSLLTESSPVFSAMFKHEWKENITNEVLIEDVDLDVLKEMLSFIYNCKIPNLKTMAAKLFSASDKYDMGYLRSWCEIELANNMTIENVAEILILADLHRCENLKERALYFMKYNQNNVVHTAGFAEILKNYPALAAEILLKVLSPEKTE